MTFEEKQKLNNYLLKIYGMIFGILKMKIMTIINKNLKMLKKNTIY